MRACVQMCITQVSVVGHLHNEWDCSACDVALVIGLDDSTHQEHTTLLSFTAHYIQVTLNNVSYCEDLCQGNCLPSIL